MIAKGQGNYETLSDINNKHIVFLLKAKCPVIAQHIGCNVGDFVILSSDGLHGALSAETITSLMIEEKDLEAKVRALVQAALDTGGKDNITVVVAKI